ncbi:hypothetical protein [uncultured Thiodictyon sp.]|jgi:tetratricopeptide (TPR) repeat protein|uniref:hypothetical protein n=1 Tax=uncultured Thiodictyon sp. TaxID=1846217 RepID=UPI0025DB5EB1|nr:hypothetical protein [uncultured Thiodictyon sp.]
MDLNAQLELLQAAAGDPKRLALAVLELGPAAAGTDLRRALTCAAVPRWFDARILAAVLDPDLAGAAETWLERLKGLSCVEGFPARAAWNVHEQTRLALREALHGEDPARMAALAARAQGAFPGETMHERIERAYHLVLADPAGAYPTLRVLDWDVRATPADGTALAQAMAEYPAHPGWPDLTRGWALLLRASRLSPYRPLGETIDDARGALGPFESTGLHSAGAWALATLGWALGYRRQPGDLDEALGALERAVSLSEGLAAQVTDAALADCDLSEALFLLGMVRAEQSSPAASAQALADHGRGIAIAEGLLDCDPGAPRPVSTLARHLELRGWLRAGRGERGLAEVDYRRAIGLREGLLAANRASAPAARDLLTVRGRLGHLLAQGGAEDCATALALAEDGLAGVECLLAANPESGETRRDLLVSLGLLGDRLSARGGPGDLERACGCYERRLEIAERLYEADPESPLAQRDRSIGYEQMARLAEQRGDPSARHWWRKTLVAIEAMQRAGTLDPADARFVEHFRRRLGR